MDTLGLVSSFVRKKRGKAFAMALSLMLAISLVPFSASAENSSYEEKSSGTEWAMTEDSTVDDSDEGGQFSSDHDADASSEAQSDGSEDGVIEEEVPSESSDGLTDPSMDEEATAEGATDSLMGDADDIDDANASSPENDSIVEQESATSLSQTVDGVIISVAADEGVFPQGTTLNVTSLASPVAETIAETKAHEMGQELVQYHAFDVTLYDKDGEVIQPEGTATVSFTNASLEGTETSLFHSSSSILGMSKIADGTTVEVDHFSPFMTLSTTWTDNGTDVTVTNEDSNLLAIDTLNSANQKYSVLATFETDEGQWYLLLGADKLQSNPQEQHPIQSLEIDGQLVYTGPVDPLDWRETFTFTGINGVPVVYDDPDWVYFAMPIDQAPPAGVEFTIFGDAGQGGAGGFDIDGTYIFAAQQLNIYHVFDQGMELDPLSGSGYATQQLTIPSWQRTGWELDYIELTVEGTTTSITPQSGNAVFDYNALQGATLVFYYAELPKYNVIHEFVSDSVDPLPQSVLDLLPPSYEDYDGSTVLPSDFQPKSVGTIDGTWSFVSWSPASQVINGADVTFTGTWTFTSGVYHVTGTIDHGTVSPDFQSVNSGDPSDPVVFNAADGYQIVKATVYIDGVGTDDTSMAGETTWTYPAVDELRNSISIVVVTEPIVYPITYVLNGGTNDPANPSSYTVTSPDISLNDATRFGYTFDGWFIDNSLSVTPVGDPAIPTGSTGSRTFYAFWSANENVNYTVHYYLEGTTTSVAPDKLVANQTFNTTVEENAINIDWYTAVAPTTQDIYLDAYGKEIAFYYTLNLFEVNHVFVSGTAGQALPQEILDRLPASFTASHGEVVMPGAVTDTTFTTDEGTWTFEGWDPDSATIDDSDITFTGTWNFVAATTPSTPTTTTTTTSVDSPSTSTPQATTPQTSDSLLFAGVLLGALALAALSVLLVTRRRAVKQEGAQTKKGRHSK